MPHPRPYSPELSLSPQFTPSTPPSPSPELELFPQPTVRRRPAPATIDLTTSPPPAKRRRHLHTTAAGTPVIPVDLDDDEHAADNAKDEAEREHEREKEATKRAAKEETERRKKGLSRVGCTICLEDEMTDLAVTPCGHVFCHRCLTGAVKASATPTNKTCGKCPVCRGRVGLKDIIVLEVRKGVRKPAEEEEEEEDPIDEGSETE